VHESFQALDAIAEDVATLYLLHFLNQSK